MKLFSSTMVTALSGMRHAENVLSASAHNVANLLTGGFQAQRASAVESPSGGVQTEVTTPVLPGPSFTRETPVYDPGAGPEATTFLSLNVNLDPTRPTTSPGQAGDNAGALLPSFATETSAHDSLGNSHQITFEFQKGDDGQWTWQATVRDLNPGGGEGGQLVIGSGSIGFNPKGNLDTETDGLLGVTFPGASPQEIQVDFGDSITTDGGSGDGSSGFVGGSRVKGIERDGHGLIGHSHGVATQLVVGSNTDVLGETINQVDALHAYSANAAALQTADEMNETLLDLLA